MINKIILRAKSKDCLAEKRNKGVKPEPIKNIAKKKSYKQ